MIQRLLTLFLKTRKRVIIFILFSLSFWEALFSPCLLFIFSSCAFHSLLCSHFISLVCVRSKIFRAAKLWSYARPPFSSHWRLKGGINGTWIRKKEQSAEGHVIYYSAPLRQLQWLPEECYPGIPANCLNVAALYEDTLKHKLAWFYSQVILARKIYRR